MATEGAGVDPNDPTKREKSPLLFAKTCQNCFSLKIRCDRTQRSDICDRCARLNKPCVFRPAKRRDNSAKRDSRIQALEQQVQNLLRIKNPASQNQLPLPETPFFAESSTSSTSSVPALEPPRLGDAIDLNTLTMERAETLIELYRSDMMPHFPFFILPAHINGRLLRYDKPFLFLSILTVACYHDPATQEKLGNQFKSMVSDKILLGGDDSLSMEHLQGMMIALAWNNYHNRSRYYSQYLHLMISIAVDMRLDRKVLRPKPSKPESKREPLHNVPQNWGSEEQRAVAGVFYLSSTISRLLDKMNTFSCTPSIEEGCAALMRKGDYKTDKDLYHVIRLQQIIENVHTLADQAYSDQQAQDAFLRTRAELEAFRAFLVTDVTESHFLFMQFHTAKLFLYQVAFFERALHHNPSLHLATLCEGLESAQSFLDLYLWLPPKSEMNLTNSEWIQLNFGVTLAAKFAIVSKDPTVEPQTRDLRRRLNIENVFRHLSLRIGALVGRTDDGQRQKDVFAYYEHRVRKIQTWYERMCRATRSDSPGHQPVHTMPPPQAPAVHSAPLGSSNPTQYGTTSHSVYVSQPTMAYPTTSSTTNAASGIGMAPTLADSASYTSTYGNMPTLAFPDLMNAPGWDMLFDIPMEDSTWLYDSASFPMSNASGVA